MNLNTEDNFYYLNKNLNKNLNKKKYKKNIIENFARMGNKALNIADAGSEVDIGKFRKVLGDMDILNDDVLKKLDDDQLLKLQKKLNLKTKQVKKTVSDSDIQLDQKQLDDIGRSIETEYTDLLNKIDKDKIKDQANKLIKSKNFDTDEIPYEVTPDEYNKLLKKYEKLAENLNSFELEEADKNIQNIFQKMKKNGVVTKEEIDDFILKHTLSFDIDTNKKFKKYINNIEKEYKNLFCKKKAFCTIDPIKFKKEFPLEFDNYLLAKKLRKRFYKFTQPGVFEQIKMMSKVKLVLLVSMVMLAGVSIAYFIAALTLANQGCKDDVFCAELTNTTGMRYKCVKREGMPDGSCVPICNKDEDCIKDMKCNTDIKTCEYPCNNLENQCPKDYLCINISKEKFSEDKTDQVKIPNDSESETKDKPPATETIGFCKLSCNNKGKKDQGKCNSVGYNGYTCSEVITKDGKTNVCTVPKQDPSQFPCLAGQAFLGIDVLSATGWKCRTQNLIIISTIIFFLLIIIFFVLKIVF